MRPGEDPIGHLAAALDQPGVLGRSDGELATHQPRACSKRRCAAARSGLVDAVRQARLPGRDNVLIVVDQFEELFRFRRSRDAGRCARRGGRVRQAAARSDRPADRSPIYVVLTMRSDFIGDCMEYPGLPEAVNEGQYLVPRMTRDELRLGDHRPGRGRRRRDRPAARPPAAERRRRQSGRAAAAAARR